MSKARSIRRASARSDISAWRVSWRDEAGKWDNRRFAGSQFFQAWGWYNAKKRVHPAAVIYAWVGSGWRIEASAYAA